MLTVHVGLHKTGSTSIQTVLSLGKGHIRRKQLYLPWGDLFVTDGHVRADNADKIISLSRRGWHVVVSSEGALGAMTQAYPHASDVAGQLAGLFSGIRLRLVLYLRPQHEWAESAFQQHRREGGTADPDTFAETLLAARGFRHAALVRDLTAALPTGGLVVRPFDRTTDVVGDFFDQCGLGIVPPAFAGLRANASGGRESTMSPFGLSTQRALRQHFEADWKRLIVDESAALDGARDQFARLLEVEAGARQIPVESTLVADAPLNVADADPKRVTRALRLTAQRLEWRLRHGPRQAALSAIVRWEGRTEVRSAGTVPRRTGVAEATLQTVGEQ